MTSPSPSSQRPSEWRCFLRDEPLTLQTNLCFVRETGDGGIEYLHHGDRGEILCTEGKRFEPIKPFMTLSVIMAQELLQSLSEALDKAGFTTPSTKKAEGLLEATKYHLEDMRKMLKLK